MSIRPKYRIRQAIRRGLSTVLPRRVFLTQGSRRSANLCLTFDDGPHPELTPRLLDLLAEYSVRATFFVIGREAEKHPSVVRRMIEEGHSVGNHTYSHPTRASLSNLDAANEVHRGAEVIGSIVGKPIRLFRPPGGKLTARDLWRLWRQGQTTVLWNVDPKDYNKQSADEVESYFQERQFRGGDLILFHDNHPHAIVVLPDLIASARDRGLTFATIDAWTT